MLAPFKGQQMKFKRQRRIGVTVKALRDILEVGPRLQLIKPPSGYPQQRQGQCHRDMSRPWCGYGRAGHK
jgi:hypothetical protein